MEEAPIPDTPPTAQHNPTFAPQAPAQLAAQFIFTGLHCPTALDFGADSADDQPAQAEAEPAALVTYYYSTPLHLASLDSSSSDDMPLQDMQFVQGCAEHGDAVDFTRRFARYVRSCGMSDYSLLKQVYACAAVCDEVTEATIEAQIEHGSFPHGPQARPR